MRANSHRRSVGPRGLNGRVLAGGSIVVALALVSALASWLAPFSPTEQHLASRLQAPGFTDALGRTYWLGTDQFGRDVLSRLLYGVRTPLVVGFTSSFLGAAMGLLVGLPAGYFRGRIDAGLSALMDLQLSLPFILVALTTVALFGPSATNIVVVFAVTSWAANARVARSVTMGLRGSAFVEAARSVGSSEVRVVLRHVVPNAVTPVFVFASVQVGQFILYEASLGFFGLGVPPPQPTWGSMLADARDYLHHAWWLGVLPGLCIALVTLSVNLLGDGLREALDPRHVPRT